MIRALSLAVRQLGDPRLLRLLVRCTILTLLLVAALGAAAWWLIDLSLARSGLDRAHLQGLGISDGAGALRGALALAGVVIGTWLLWRAAAMAVLQFHADEVVEAVEARHYPRAHATARPPGRRREAAAALRGAVRALGWNALALPFALALLVTGVGTALLFWAVNAVLLGRELVDMAGLRHPGIAPVTRGERLALGGVVAGLMLVPIVNFLAPFVGAAAATHLVHGRGITDRRTDKGRLRDAD